MSNKQDVIWELLAKKLSGEATAAEQTELEALLRQHPDMHYAAGHLSDLWKQDAPVSLHQREQAFADHLDRMKLAGVDWDEPVKSGRRVVMKWLTAAAAVVLLAAAAWWLMPARNTAAPAVAEEVHAEKGTRSRVTLPDGSVVWLNADSRLTYKDDFNGALREVYLEGEAYFDVVKDADKPFIIHTARMHIRVLGTTFNVRAYPNERTAETALIRGSVEVSAQGEKMRPVILRPNEKLVLYLDGQQPDTINEQPKQEFAIRPLHVAEQDGLPLETAWVENKLVFRDEAFGTLAARLERWYGVQISLNGPEVKDLRFTGRFEKETIEQVLKALQITAEFRYSMNGKNISIFQQ
ncbi:FecR family protein [Chitinophaga alhagiae]|uniref:FecR family protein n=1 Tax=Chitinophaga alhagiae TaxID=2203219 RepID=UPI000E5B6294|nr:FecR domain-containing protein [Chitinophaga alhagiae]